MLVLHFDSEFLVIRIEAKGEARRVLAAQLLVQTQFELWPLGFENVSIKIQTQADAVLQFATASEFKLSFVFHLVGQKKRVKTLFNSKTDWTVHVISFEEPWEP